MDSRDLFELLPQPAWVYDCQTLRFLAVSRSAERAYGYSRDEFLAMTIEEIRPPEEVPALRAHLQGATGEAGRAEWHHRRKDGSTFAVQITAESVTFEGREARLVIATDVTDRVRATAALRESEEHFRRIADHVPAILWSSEPDGHSTWVNRQWLEFRGTTMGEELGLGWSESVHPDDFDRYMAVCQDAFSHRLPLTAEFRAKDRHGQWRVLFSRGEPYTAPDGTFHGYLGTCIDVTDLRAAEREAALYAEIVRHMPIGAYVQRLEDRGDPESFRFVAVNPASEEVNRVPAGDLVGKKCSDVFKGPESRRINEALREVILTGQGRDLGEIRPGGPLSEGIYHLKAFPLPGDHVVVLHRNVTAQVLALEELTRQKELLQTVFDHIPAMVVVFDEQGKLTAVNREWERVLGYTLQETQQGDIFAKLYPDPVNAEKVRAFIVNADRTWGDFVTRARDGRQIETSWANVRLSDGRGIGIGQDVAERKRLEAQLRHAQKMESVGRLAGGVAHDFNNLLTAILGFTSLAEQCLPSESPARRSLDEVRKAGERAASLTRQLLVFSRKQVVMPEIIDLCDVVTDVSGMLRRMIGEDVRLHTELAAREATIQADRGQIEQVLVNLAVNARDAMPNGGDLWLRVDRVGGDPSSAAEEGGGGSVALTIRDSGIGMSDEVRSHLFEPFFTTKPTGEGTGLGLATVYGIVQQSGGSIDVETSPGRGAAFHITLPWHGREGHAVRSSKGTIAAAGGCESILLVEDEAAVRRLIAAVLEASGYRVQAAASGEEALRIAANPENPIDLVLSDLVMPETDGRQVVEQIRGMRPTLRHLYMSGYTSDAIVRRGILTGDSPFIQKPFLPAALLAKVREVLDSGRGRAAVESR